MAAEIDYGILDEDDELSARVRAQTDQFFNSGRWGGPIGVEAASLITLFLSWPHLSHSQLLIWFIFATMSALGMFLGETVPALRRRTNSLGLPYSAMVATSAVGLVFGSVLWIDIGSIQASEARLTLLVVLFALTAGSMGGTAGITGLGQFMIFPTWGLAAAALFVSQEYLVGAGCVVFVLLMARDLRSTREMLFESIFLRELSRSRAHSAQQAANRDPLTGLLNRSGLEAATKATAERPNQITAMFIDLDHFKVVNDRFGHDAGDAVLLEVTERLITTVRPGDIIARLGGDEFLLIFEDELSDDTRMHIADELISNIEVPFSIGANEARISASVGITVVEASAFELNAVQREADRALYVAKGRGRRRSVHFDDRVRHELAERSDIETGLRRAIATRQIEPWGQPIVSIYSGEIRVVEFLARWRRSDGTFCPPDVFIPLAEEIGLIDDLGRHMLNRAGETLSAWRDHPHLSGVSVSVNVSPRQLIDEKFSEQIAELVDEWQLEPGKLILELTETAELHDAPLMRQTLDEVVAHGVLLALDDFGSGYSSVQHLIGLPIEYVKLDGALITDLGRDERQTALVRSIRDLAATLGRTVVVEGVEHARQAKQIAELKIELVQGFLYGAARPLHEIPLIAAETGDLALMRASRDLDDSEREAHGRLTRERRRVS
ncbi:MAG: EAL domain-containing protein [Acidimicrobiales bacterium]